MIKKSIFLIIVLLISSLVVVFSQDIDAISRIMQQYQPQMDQLAADMQTGRISAEEFNRRTNALRQEMAAAIQQAQTASPTFNQAQLQRLEELFERAKVVEASFNESRITQDEYDRQGAAISGEIAQITKPLEQSPSALNQIGDIQKKMNERWPGVHAGWPPAEGERGYRPLSGVGPLRQAAGTRASYSYETTLGGKIYSYLIYQTGATSAMLQDLRRQIEITLGKTLESTGTNSFGLDVTTGTFEGIREYDIHRVSLSNEGVLIYRWATGFYD